MRQSYNATNYSDEGYLFLLVDFCKRIAADLCAFVAAAGME